MRVSMYVNEKPGQYLTFRSFSLNYIQLRITVLSGHQSAIYMQYYVLLPISQRFLTMIFSNAASRHFHGRDVFQLQISTRIHVFTFGTATFDGQNKIRRVMHRMSLTETEVPDMILVKYVSGQNSSETSRYLDESDMPMYGRSSGSSLVPTIEMSVLPADDHDWIEVLCQSFRKHDYQVLETIAELEQVLEVEHTLRNASLKECFSLSPHVSRKATAIDTGRLLLWFR